MAGIFPAFFMASRLPPIQKTPPRNWPSPSFDPGKHDPPILQFSFGRFHENDDRDHRTRGASRRLRIRFAAFGFPQAFAIAVLDHTQANGAGSFGALHAGAAEPHRRRRP